MEDKKEWLLSFVLEFRKILDSKDYHEYKEFFPAFCNTPYLSIELHEIYNKQEQHIRNTITLYSSEYGDQVKIVKLKDTFWIPFLKELGYSLENLTEYMKMGGDLTDSQAIQNYYKYTKDFMVNVSQKEFKNKIDIPLNFLEQDLTNIIQKIIDQEILSKLRILTNNHLYQKAINRISLLKSDEINEIIKFLDSEWSRTEEPAKCEKFAKIFYSLGFEVIPIENLLDHRNFRDLNNLSHPELIAYDPNSNYILLFEELTKLNKENLYKKDTVQKIIVRFKDFFYIENRKIDYLIITSEISIDLDHYNYQYRVILKEIFIDLLKTVFNEELSQINISENLQIRFKIIRLINSLKSLNYSNNKKKL